MGQNQLLLYKKYTFDLQLGCILTTFLPAGELEYEEIWQTTEYELFQTQYQQYQSTLLFTIQKFSSTQHNYFYNILVINSNGLRMLNISEKYKFTSRSHTSHLYSQVIFAEQSVSCEGKVWVQCDVLCDVTCSLQNIVYNSSCELQFSLNNSLN